MRQTRILFFWLPLYGSWLLMTLEGPLLSAIINRLPDEVVMLAAMGLVFTLAVTIESPVISLLSTSTKWVRDRRSYEMVRRFTLQWSIGLTIVAWALSYTRLFDWLVIDALGTPLPIAVWVRPGLQIMVLWTAAIAWRRFLQGVLIRFGRPRAMAQGTLMRLVVTIGTGLSLAVWTERPGVEIAAFSLMAGVISEAFFATWAVRPVLRDLPATVEATADLTPSSLMRFHLPLAATSVMALISQPLVAFTLARLDRPELTLAAWPLVFQALLALRSSAMSLPEAVIALAEEGDSALAALRRFSLRLAGLNLALMAVLVATPLATLYLTRLQDAVPEVASLAWFGVLVFVPLPALGTLVAWQHGYLIHLGKTQWINQSMALQLVVMSGLLAIGLALRLPGMLTAAIAMESAIIVRLVFLEWRSKSLRVAIA